MAYKRIENRRAYEKKWRDRRSKETKARYAAIRKARKEKHQALLDRLKAVPCADCKAVFPAYCMDFDHLPQFKKKADVSRLVSNSLEILMAEVAKCDVVCAICHRHRTFNRRRTI